MFKLTTPYHSPALSEARVETGGKSSRQGLGGVLLLLAWLIFFLQHPGPPAKKKHCPQWAGAGGGGALPYQSSTKIRHTCPQTNLIQPLSQLRVLIKSLWLVSN